MSDYDGTILFKQWLPDQADLNNPGLTEAQNVLPVDDSYRSFATLGAAVGLTLNARVQGAFFSLIPPSSFYEFSGTSSKLYAGGADKSAATYNTASTGFWRFAMYSDKIIATNGVDLPQYRAASTTGNFSTLGSSSGTAPSAVHVEAVGQFVMLGNLPTTQSNFLRWSGVDAPLSWPTPLSATAIAQQSGEQELNFHYGAVMGLAGGDQFGIALQENGIYRFTYVGGSVVFQFDDIAAGVGSAFPNANVRVGNLVYFVSPNGFFVTDGVIAKPIGKSKTDRYFAANCDFTYRQRVYGAHDGRNRCVWWGFPSSAASSGMPDRIIIYNYLEDRWSRAEVTHEVLTTFGSLLNTFSSSIVGFANDTRWSYFNGAPGSAILTTAEYEPNPAGFSSYQGVKPLVDATVNAITVAMGTRNNRTDAVSYSSETTANSRSGFANFRTAARYHRARLTIAGTFNAAQGIEYQAEASGYA